MSYERRSAPDEVTAFLDTRATIRSLDHEDILSINVGHESEAHLYASDLRALVALASAAQQESLPLVAFDYEAALDERHIQEDRLTQAGINTSGGGVDMTTGRWDIFAYGDDDVYATVLSTVTAVDDFISKHGGKA